MTRSSFLLALLSLWFSPLLSCEDRKQKGIAEEKVAYRIGIFGDTHAGYDGSEGGQPAELIHTQINSKLCAWNPDLVIHLGDAIYNTATDQWKQFDALAEPLIKACPNYWPTQGNHDNGDGGWQGFFDYFSWLPEECTFDLPCYHILIDSLVLLISLCVFDASEMPPSCQDYSAQVRWLENMLTVYEDIPLKFVFFHRPPYTTGGRGSDRCARVLDDIISGNADAVFNGHIHPYERFEVHGVHYIVTGGAGGFPHKLEQARDTFALLPLRKASYQGYNYVTCEVARSKDVLKAHIEAHALNGDVFDEIVLDKSDFSVSLEKPLIL